MKKNDYGLGNAHSLTAYVEQQVANLKKREQTFQSVFEFVFSLDNNVMAEYTDGNRVYYMTYGECKKSIFKLTGVLKRTMSGLPKKTLVGIYMDNSPQWIQIFWALLRSGYVPLLMNKRLNRQMLDEVLETNKVGAVISDGDTFNVPTFNYKELCDASVKETDAEPDWADETVFMSSGTSMKVKLCIYDGKKICQQLYNSEKIIRDSKEIRAHVDGKLKQLTFLPFYHVFGFLACYMWFAFFTRTFVFLNNYHSDTILKTVRKHKVTHIFAVPMLWTKIEAGARKVIAERGEKTNSKFNRALALSQKLQNAGLGNGFAKLAFREVRENLFGESIRFMISGGGNIPKRTLAFFNGIGYRLVNGYGMTEIGITSVQLSNKPRIINTGSVGKPFSSVEYRTVNGELAVKGNSLATFVVADGKKRELEESKWFLTEDLAEFKNGTWFLNGRKDDMIVNASGENICPQFIEERIDVQGTECALLGIPTDDGTVRSQLIVSVDSKLNPEEIRSEIISQLKTGGLYRQVDDIKLTYEPLIKGSEFKLNRKRIKADILSGKITFISEEKQTFSNEPTDSLKKHIIKAFEKALEKKLTDDQYDYNFFYQLGGTSLCYFELVEEIKRDFGLDMLSDDSKVLYSVNDVYNYIKENISENTMEEFENGKLS